MAVSRGRHVKIVAFDPGTRRMGFAEFEDGKALGCGSVSFNTKVDMLERLPEIYHAVALKLEQSHPDLVVIETHESYTRGGRNVEALQGLGIVVGIILGSSLERCLWVKTVLPSEWNPRRWSHGLVSGMMVKKHGLRGNHDAHAALMIAEYASSQIKIWEAQRQAGDGRLKVRDIVASGARRARRERMPTKNVSRKIEQLLKREG